MLFQRTKELYSWRLEQGQEISALRKRVDKDNDSIVDNRQTIVLSCPFSTSFFTFIFFTQDDFLTLIHFSDLMKI